MKKKPTRGGDSHSLRIRKRIIRKIERGEYLPGEKLAGERELAKQYDVTRRTVQYALDELAKKDIWSEDREAAPLSERTSLIRWI